MRISCLTKMNDSEIRASAIRSVEERTVFVGGINLSDDDDLEDYFLKFGPIDSTDVARHPCGMSRSFGFVTYEEKFSAGECLDYDAYHEIADDIWVEVRYCRLPDSLPEHHTLYQRVKDVSTLYSMEERTVFVGGINCSNEADLEDYFEVFGSIASVDVAYHPCGKPRSFGFVTYEEKWSAEDCLEYDKYNDKYNEEYNKYHELYNGQTVAVKRCRLPEPLPYHHTLRHRLEEATHKSQRSDASNRQQLSASASASASAAASASASSSASRAPNASTSGMSGSATIAANYASFASSGALSFSSAIATPSAHGSAPSSGIKASVSVSGTKTAFSDSSFAPGSGATNAGSVSLVSLVNGERVVWIDDNGPKHGAVRWVGQLPEYGLQTVVGLELDKAVGDGTGKYGDRQLFIARLNHAAVVPLAGLMKEKDFLGADQSKAKELKDEEECQICFEKKIDSAFYACGHSCLCYECAIACKTAQPALCPICRATIRDVIRIYRP